MTRKTKRKINYIGSFPPPYGGVTIRNNEFLVALASRYKVKVFDTSHLNNTYSYLKLLGFLLRNILNSGVISTSTPSFLKLTKVLNILFPFLMPKYIIITTGGTVDKQLANSNIPIKVLNKYKSYFIETRKLKINIDNLGIENTNFLPNCRLEPKDRQFKGRENETDVRFISISRISYEKGIDVIIEANKLLNENLNYYIDFYGPVDDEIKEIFFDHIDNNKKASYKGIFEGDKYDINDLLIDYDVLLFPTRHLSEGHPGVLTNAKIAGCTILATDINANADIVKDKVDGMIMKELTTKDLVEDMTLLINDIDLLDKLKQKSYLSADQFFVGNYLNGIIKVIEC